MLSMGVTTIGIVNVDFLLCELTPADISTDIYRFAQP